MTTADRPNLAQTIVLLALSRRERPPVFPVMTRRYLLRRRWIVPPHYDITQPGLAALATSPFLDEAQRRLDAEKDRKPCP